MRDNGITAALTVFGLCFFLAWLAPRAASADIAGIDTSATFNFGYTDMTITDKQTGQVTKTISTIFEETYNFSFQRQIYPALEVHAGGVFDDLHEGGTEGPASMQLLRPYAGLSFGTEPIRTSFDWSEIQTSQESNGVATPTATQTTYTLNLQWTPAELPPVTLQYVDSRYTQGGALMATSSDNLTWRWTNISPIDNVQLNYNGGYQKGTDEVTGTSQTVFQNNALVSYLQSFLDNRINAGMNYQIQEGQDTIEVISSSGVANFQATDVLHGFSLPLGTYTSQPFEQFPGDTTNVNNGLVSGSAATGIDLGSQAGPANVVPGSLWNFGIEFQGATAVSSLYVYLDHDIAQGIEPTSFAQIAGMFQWQVCTSGSDQLGSWVCQPISASYKQVDPSGALRPGFELDLPGGLVTPWVKVAVNPLSSIQNIAVTLSQILLVPNQRQQFFHINVTQMLAFQSQTLKQGQATTSTNLLQAYNANVSVLLMANPRLTYNSGFFYSLNSTSHGASLSTWTFSNGLSLFRKFNPIFSGVASVAMDQTGGSSISPYTAYSYSASLNATPMPTLYGSFVYSGSASDVSGSSGMTNSFLLTSTAQPYQGIDLNMTGGVTFLTSSGKSTISYLYNVGTSIVPYPTVTLGFSYSENTTQNGTAPAAPGVVSGSSETYTRVLNASVSWTPFTTLFLSAGIYKDETQNLSQTTANYNISWSPLQGGALQLGALYTQTLTNNPFGRVTTYGPTLSLQLSSRFIGSASYLVTKTEDDYSITDTDSFFATLRIVF